MKRVVIILLSVTLSGSCDPSTEAPYVSSCDQAREYIYDCLGYLPHIERCTPEIASKVLTTKCGDLEDLWR
jgi:hypothetical protein